MLLIQIFFCYICVQTTLAVVSMEMTIWREDPDWKHSNETLRHFNVYQILECREKFGQHIDWLKHDNFDRCITVVSDYNILPCVYSQFVRNNMTYKLKSKQRMVSRDLKRVRVQSTSCSAYMIFSRDVEFVHRLFTEKQRHFRPFTKIFMISPPWMRLQWKNVLDAMGHGYKIYAVRNSLYDTSLDYVDLSYISLYNPYMNHTLNTSIHDKHVIDEYYGHPSTHALFDKKVWRYQKKVFKVGVFNCPPYIIVNNNDTKE